MAYEAKGLRKGNGRIAVVLPKSLLSDLDNAAAKQGKTKSLIIREACEQWCKKNKHLL